MHTIPMIRQFVTDTFLYRASAQALCDDDSFLDAGLIDSTGILELVGFVEKSFGISVADAEIVPENFDSVSKLSEYIRRKRATSVPEPHRVPCELSS
jgi:acyl carrier protein